MGLSLFNCQRSRATVLRLPESFCGADRSRTGDLRLAKPALSQLSYGPLGLVLHTLI